MGRAVLVVLCILLMTAACGCLLPTTETATVPARQDGVMGTFNHTVHAGKGEVLKWDFTTNGSVEFMIKGPDNDLVYHNPTTTGLAREFEAKSTGDHTFRWINPHRDRDLRLEFEIDIGDPFWDTVMWVGPSIIIVVIVIIVLAMYIAHRQAEQ